MMQSKATFPTSTRRQEEKSKLSDDDSFPNQTLSLWQMTTPKAKEPERDSKEPTEATGPPSSSCDYSEFADTQFENLHLPSEKD